ncbi:MAG TPA: 16S rRNA (guanine(527)-N(7))-methyltransferase RsmG [candidate division Zixibacteria bacterium]|nr:16S rRNA (guanine(527)-N(7))-methyltransferase RsmG [candidate division Zixibacteria bacterium]HEQ97787.1 16S rRNA (guanine(527)-N(7))-methyltransferase RsmG [candidate division Zixibacteria bacterium]
MIFRDDIETYLHQFGVEYSGEILAALDSYARLVEKFNASLNLVSKTDTGSEIVKQIIDSSALTKFMSPEKNSTLLDIGSGAGFPGIVLKIFWPEIHLISLDSSPRKITFQDEAASKLNLRDCEFVNLQFQEYRPEREIDYITVKALGNFKKVLAFAGRALREEGSLIFYLGETVPEELKEIEDAPFRLGSENLYSLPNYPGDLRFLKLIKTV